MADAILHIKDGYYFDVPKFCWGYDSLDEVPQWLRDAHPHATLAEFQQELNGKIIIPQPFGTLENLYTKKSGVCISKFMILEAIAAVLVSVIFIRLRKRMAVGLVPKGRFWNLFESFLVFLRDEVARPVMGEHDADRFLPLLWTLFFFILTCNLLGMVPWAGSPTAAFGVTLGLAFVTFSTGVVCGLRAQGPGWLWSNFVPHMDLPIYMAPLKLLIFAIEVLGFCIKHGVLAIRLLANMVAGHVVLLAFLGMIVTAATASAAAWTGVTLISLVASTALGCLELFVAFLQAYIFTFLSALFIGAAVHHH